MLRFLTLLLLFLCLGAASARAQIFSPQTQPQAQPKPQPQVQPRPQPQVQPQAQFSRRPRRGLPPMTATCNGFPKFSARCTSCAAFAVSNEGQKWRNEAQALIEAEAPSGERHDQMVSSFNRGYRSFQQSYRTCTPAANFAIRRYLDEGAKIAREITARYAN